MTALCTAVQQLHQRLREPADLGHPHQRRPRGDGRAPQPRAAHACGPTAEAAPASDSPIGASGTCDTVSPAGRWTSTLTRPTAGSRGHRRAGDVGWRIVEGVWGPIQRATP